MLPKHTHLRVQMRLWVFGAGLVESNIALQVDGETWWQYRVKEGSVGSCNHGWLPHRLPVLRLGANETDESAGRQGCFVDLDETRRSHEAASVTIAVTVTSEVVSEIRWGFSDVRVLVDGCNSGAPVGLQSGGVADVNLTASSAAPNAAPPLARLHNAAGAWCAASSAPSWLQIDMSRSTLLTAVAIQGGLQQWVTAFSIQTCEGNVCFDHKGPDRQPQIFRGNSDGETVVRAPGLVLAVTALCLL